MLLDQQIILMNGLRGDCHQQCAAFAYSWVSIAPGSQLRHAIGAPASAKKIDDQRSQRQQIGGSNNAAIVVLQGEFRGNAAWWENPLLDAARKQLRNRTLAWLKPLRLDQPPGLLTDLIELVL